MSEVYVFRPGEVPLPPGSYVSCKGGFRSPPGAWLRYADGLWLPDNGKYDLAFVSTQNPIALGVSLPIWEGIEWSWMDAKAAYAAVGVESSLIHPWHSQVRDPAEGPGRHIGIVESDAHPNGAAYQAASRKCCELHGCANGRGPSFVLDNEWMLARLVRKLDGETVRPPEHPVCYLCANDGAGHKLLYLKAWQEDVASRLGYARARADKLVGDLADEQIEVERLTERLARFEALMAMREVQEVNCG